MCRSYLQTLNFKIFDGCEWVGNFTETELMPWKAQQSMTYDFPFLQKTFPQVCVESIIVMK